MRIRAIDTNNKKDIHQFIQFPFDLYKGDPNWVPPMVNDMQRALSPGSHPVHRHSTTEYFIAEDHGRTLGRIALVENQRFIEFTGQKAAFFNFFEVVEDIEVNRALLNFAAEWARNRGLESIIGPKGLAQGEASGILVEGFEYKPAMGIAYNPPYYDAFLRDFGFEKEVDYLSGFLTTDYHLDERVVKLAERVKNRRGFWVKRFASKDEMREWIPRIRGVYNRAFEVVPNFVPITEEEAQLFAERLLSIAHPRLIKLIFKGDELVGFLFAYHNVSEGLQKARGRMWPFGWFHLLRAFKTTRWVDINGIGLLPEHQGVGATAVLYTELEKSIREFPFKYADIVQIAEDNLKSFREMDRLGVQWHKRHRVYRKDITL